MVLTAVKWVEVWDPGEIISGLVLLQEVYSDTCLAAGTLDITVHTMGAGVQHGAAQDSVGTHGDQEEWKPAQELEQHQVKADLLHYIKIIN